MMANTKQLRITKMFRKGAAKLPEIPDDCDELQEDIKQLELKLKEKQNELFELQRNSYKYKFHLTKKKAESFMGPDKLVLSSSTHSIQQDLDLMSMLSGIEVQSYVVDDHCCIIFNMQHDADHQVKHGLRIDLKSGVNQVSKSSLPLGFNLQAVMEEFDNIMMPECLGAIRRALVAYYDRLEQFEALKKLLNVEAQFFKTLDGSHMEVSFVAQGDRDVNADPLDLVLLLDYRVYDIRPKYVLVKDTNLLHEAQSVLEEQCMIFKRRPLRKAFKEAFISGFGAYKLVEQVGIKPIEQQTRRRKRDKQQDKNYYNNDDTFRPEDCPDDSDDGDVA